jgi:hypothetical protein
MGHRSDKTVLVEAELANLTWLVANWQRLPSEVQTSIIAIAQNVFPAQP